MIEKYLSDIYSKQKEALKEKMDTRKKFIQQKINKKNFICC